MVGVDGDDDGADHGDLGWAWIHDDPGYHGTNHAITVISMMTGAHMVIPVMIVDHARIPNDDTCS